MLSDRDKAILRAMSKMEQGGDPVSEVDTVVEMLRQILAEEQATVYRFLHALTWAMRIGGHHTTGRLIEQARYAFYYEGQGYELPSDDGDTATDQGEGDIPPHPC